MAGHKLRQLNGLQLNWDVIFTKVAIDQKGEVFIVRIESIMDMNEIYRKNCMRLK